MKRYPKGRRCSPYANSQVPIYTEGPQAGTPANAFGNGKHITIGGEKENSLFSDYDIEPGHLPSRLEGYKRPFTTTLPDNSVSHFIFRSTPLEDKTWDEIIRLKTDEAVVTIAGPPEYVMSVYSDVQKEKVITKFRAITAPNSIVKGQQTIPTEGEASDATGDVWAFSVLLGKESQRPTLQ